MKLRNNSLFGEEWKEGGRGGGERGERGKGPLCFEGRSFHILTISSGAGLSSSSYLHTICVEAMDPCGCRDLKKTTFGLLQIETEINTFIKYLCNPQHSELIVT